MSTEDWFKTKILYKRYFFIVLWNLLIQAVLVWAAKILDVLLSPANDIVSLSISTAIYSQIYLCLLVFGLCSLFFKNIKVHPELSGSPLSILCGLLKPRNWMQAAAFVTLGMLWSQRLVTFSANPSYQSFWQQIPPFVPESSDYCVNEHHLFVFLHGAFMGLHFHFAYQMRHLYCLKFDSVKQLKLPSTKSNLKKQVKLSIFVVLKKVRSFYLFYYLFGFIPKHLVSHTLGQKFCGNVSLTSLSGLFDFKLYVTVCVVGIVVYASWTIALTLVKVFLTENFSFPPDASLEHDKFKLLTDAISGKSSELLQYLAFQNLNSVAQYSSAGRKKIFSISIPGGHPHIWNEISGRCIQIVDDFHSCLCLAISTTSGNSKPGLVSQLNISNYLNQTLQTNGVTSYPQMTSTPQSPSSRLSTHIGTPSLRSSIKARNMVDKNIISQTPKVPIVKVDKVYAYKGYVTDILTKTLENVMSKPVVKFLTVEPNERKLEKLMCSCQLAIWSVQILSFLVRASYTEDNNGVVQWSLSRIISSLLELQMAMERCPKGMLRNSYSRETFFAPPKSFCLKQSLNAAINSGLYYVSCTFKHNLKYIELSDDHWNRIERYLQMRE